MTSHTQLLVYNSENRFVGSFYQFTCRVKRVKRYFEKSVFWDRLIIIVLKVKQWRDEGEIQNECDGPCYKVMLKVKDWFGDIRTVTTTYEGNLKPNHLKP